MNILVVTEMYPRRTEPIAGIFVHGECLALKRAGFGVRVLSPLPYSPRVLWGNPQWKKLGLTPRSDTHDGIPVRYPRYPRPPGGFYRKLEPFAMFPGVYASARSWAQEEPFDLIHAQGLLPCGMAALLLSRALGLPCICQARGSDINVYAKESKANLFLTRHVIEKCDAPAAVSKDLARKMCSISRKRKIEVLYTTVETEVFTPSPGLKAGLRECLGMSPHSFVAIYVGELSRRKGVADLIGAWRDVANEIPEPLLVLVGDGPLRRLASLGSHVLLRGPRPHSEVALWMQASDVLLLPSYSEGLPTVVAEAMACGLPVIASAVGGIPEAVADGETGFLIRPGDRHALGSLVLVLARDENRRRFMGFLARKRATELFHPDRYIAQARALYEGVVRHRPPVEAGRSCCARG